MLILQLVLLKIPKVVIVSIAAARGKHLLYRKLLYKIIHVSDKYIVWGILYAKESVISVHIVLDENSL